MAFRSCVGLGSLSVLALLASAALGACSDDGEATHPAIGGAGGSSQGGHATSTGGSGGEAASGTTSSTADGGTGGSSVGGSGGAVSTGGAGGSPNLHECPAGGEPACSPVPDPTPIECGDYDPCYLTIVQNAIHALYDSNPGYFDFVSHEGCVEVVNMTGYLDGVAANIEAAGLCTDYDVNAFEEMAVKFDNSFSETFDIITDDGSGLFCVRDGGGCYRGWCSPSWF